MDAGLLNRRVTFQRNVGAAGFKGSGTEDWQNIVTIWAEVQDILPSRADRVTDSVTVSNRPARIRTRYRTDLDDAKRMIVGERVLQTMAGPAVLGNKDGLEFLAEEQIGGGRG